MTPTILAIDPGTDKSGVIFWHDGLVPGDRAAEVVDNKVLLERIRDNEYPASHFAIEQIRSYGMAIGATTLDTVEWCGRLIEAWVWMKLNAFDADLGINFEERVLRIPRLEIKVHLCGSARAKDQNIRQALIDRLGPPGTKKNPGPTYGVTSHMWSALAVAVTAHDKLKEQGE